MESDNWASPSVPGFLGSPGPAFRPWSSRRRSSRALATGHLCLEFGANAAPASLKCSELHLEAARPGVSVLEHRPGGGLYWNKLRHLARPNCAWGRPVGNLAGRTPQEAQTCPDACPGLPAPLCDFASWREHSRPGTGRWFLLAGASSSAVVLFLRCCPKAAPP